jgi:predicted unusual protein kinase regulating ubiquinone biosynthesis (AarF/ABC1/UbiB family)
MQHHPVYRVFSVTRLVGQIYAGYKAIQLLGKVTSSDFADDQLRRHHRRCAELVYRTAADLQGLLIKSCQFIGTRADVLPDEYIEVLSRLHDRVPPRPVAEIMRTIEAELGLPVSEVFSEFDATPLAAASLAQVHRATTRDGREVAVKVQYDNIAHLVDVDLRTFSFFVNLLARIEKTFDMRLVIRELSKYLPRELDFEHEASNSAHIRANLSGRGDVIVPEVLREYTTKKLLVMEYVPGIKVTDVAALKEAGIDKHHVAHLLSEVYCHQILIDGFFHADPHPGNILVQPGPRLVLLDFGLAKDFPPGFQLRIVELTGSILANDPARTAAAFAALGFRTRNGDPDTLLALGEAFLGRVAREGKAYADKELIEQLNEELPRVLRANPIVEAPSDILLVIRVMGLLAGIGKQLDSKVDPMAMLLPFVAGTGAGAADTVH